VNGQTNSGDGQPRVVVGVDGSAGSRAALLWALPAAAARGARLEVLAAFPVDFYWTDVYVGDPSRIEQVRSHTETRARALVAEVRSDPAMIGTETTPIDVRVVPAPPAEQLVEHSRGADLLVVGSRGRGELRSALLGSVALHCSAHARCPVVVVHPAQPGPAAPVVVGFDDTPSARDALRRGVDEARRLGAAVEVVTAFMPFSWWDVLPVVETDPVEQTRRRIEERAQRAVAEVLSGSSRGDEPVVRVQAVVGFVTDELIRKSEDARLLVVGSHSRSRLVGMTLGSVALHCVAHAHCPVMVVRPEPAEPSRADVEAPTAARGPAAR
jgi:nucleotide-binding universal stress UspA family protein